jgi:predicted GNAT family acetyltransferase
MRAIEFLTESNTNLDFRVKKKDNMIEIMADIDGQLAGYVKFNIQGKNLTAGKVVVSPEHRRQGIATALYNHAKSLGYNVTPSSSKTDDGKALWKEKTIWEDEVDEMALKQFTPMGDFNKPGPFRGVDKRLVTHPTNQLKTAKFFEQTPYDFRLFFSNIPGTGKYSETGPVNSQQLQQMFGDDVAHQIIDGSDDAITVVFVGNSGDSKVMMTPWIMAHRIGHAIQAGERRGDRNGTWRAAEQHFFQGINNLLVDFYGRNEINQNARTHFNTSHAKEYNALFNAIGTQRSSRTNKITRPYEFMYELFAQYLGTGNITLNPLPQEKGYGRQAWGRHTKSLNMRHDMKDESEYTTEVLARDMELMFDDVLSSLVGKVLVM